MQLSARNQLTGTVRSVELGAVMAEVTVDVAGQEIVSAITRSSAERLGLAEGQPVTVFIKATEVILGVSRPPAAWNSQRASSAWTPFTASHSASDSSATPIGSRIPGTSRSDIAGGDQRQRVRDVAQASQDHQRADDAGDEP